MSKRGRRRLRKPSRQTPSKAKTVEKDRSLFHYTDANGLIGIIETQSLFATHADFLNDSTECRSILAVLLPRLEAELRELTPTLVERGIFHPSVQTDYGDAIYRQEAENMLRAMVQAANNTAPFFITSFCIHEPGTQAYEHGLLSQWRGYARGGFAIEFDELGVDRLNREENERFRYAGILTDSVSYRDHEKSVPADRFSGLAGALLKGLFPESVEKLSEVVGKKVIDDFARSFLSIAPFLKDATFEEENEFRIVAMCNRPKVFEESEKRKVKPIKFRSRAAGQVVPYISLYQKPKSLLGSQPKVKLPIKSIIVGPHHYQENQRAALDILLEQASLDAAVRFSKIPFRD